MKNNGKKLEDSIFKIQKTINPASAKVELNKRFKNNAGNLREFDVVVTNPISNITTAFECKDFTKAVPVKEVEALFSKKLRTSTINNIALVSKKGYQKDAISCARDFKIPLFNFTDNYLQEQCNFNNVKGTFVVKSIKFLSEKDEKIIDYSEDFFLNSEQENYELIYLLGQKAHNTVKVNSSNFFKLFIIQFAMNEIDLNIPLYRHFTAKLLEPIKFRDSINLYTDIIISIEFKLTAHASDILENKIYSQLIDEKNIPKAGLSKLNLSNGKTVDCVIADDKLKLFLNHKNGMIEEFEVLAKFDKNGNLL